MSELGPKARALLASTRDGDDPSERDRARVQRRLSIAIAAAAGSAAASAAVPAAATKAGIGAQLAAGSQAVAASGVGAKISVAVTVAVISVAGSAVVSNAVEPAASAGEAPAAFVPRAHHQLARRHVLLPVPAIAALAEEPEVAEDVLPLDVMPVEAVAVVPVRTALQRDKPAGPASPSIASELSLLSVAQAALRQGEPARALALLDEHAARFPSGVLALERDAARAIALCDAGRIGEGRDAARALPAGMSSSPLAARVTRACEP